MGHDTDDGHDGRPDRQDRERDQGDVPTRRSVAAAHQELASSARSSDRQRNVSDVSPG